MQIINRCSFNSPANSLTCSFFFLLLLGPEGLARWGQLGNLLTFIVLISTIRPMSLNSRSIYYQKMETMMKTANVREEEEDTMSRFFGGLNREITHLVDRNPPPYLEDMYDYALKIEDQWKEEKEH